MARRVRFSAASMAGRCSIVVVSLVYQRTLDTRLAWSFELGVGSEKSLMEGGMNKPSLAKMPAPSSAIPTILSSWSTMESFN